MLELDRVNKAIAEAKDKINNYPSAIQKKKKELTAFINQACNWHQQINKVSRSDEEDLQLIADVYNIRLHAIQAIERVM